MSSSTALAGLTAASSDIDVRGNNIANSNTTGFKTARAEFTDVYASSGLGVSANSVGSGVKVSAVTQQFTQGNLTSSERSLDLAIDGNGFFVLDNNGTASYSRAGAFFVDQNGFISNSNLQQLVGFITDSSGNITGATGSLQIQNNNIAPKATADISVEINLDSTELPPTSAFVSGFTPTNLPSSNTYNNSTSMSIFDSLGNSHILAMYYVKSHVPNVWHVHVGIDGQDVTPTTPALPNTGLGPYPTIYAAGVNPAPFTLVFSSNGSFVPNSASSLPAYYGPVPVTSGATALTNSGSLNAINLNDLTINGVVIKPSSATSDTVSTTDNAASSISMVAAINASTSLHGVTASVNPNTFTLTAPTYGALAAGNLTINGVPIIGANTNQAALQTLINAQSIATGVVASISGANMLLTAADGRNIELATNGTAAAATFTNFATTGGGGALDEVQRGTFNLTNANNEQIAISGNIPSHASLSTGIMAGIVQTSSDLLSIPSWNPATGAVTPQALTLDLLGSTQYASQFAVETLTQDGFTTGRLAGVAVDSTGIITASYGNGQSQNLGQVALANFSNTQGLQPLGNSCWGETFSSGVALLGFPNTSDLGLVQGGALEDSNVDLTGELVGLIVAQSNFQANAQCIRTADTITQTILNIR